jgi:DinB superfamily
VDALQFFALRYDAIHTGTVDSLLNDLSDEQARARPHGLNSIAWLLWHAARVEDLAMNRFVADRPQVLVDGNWTGRLGIERRDTGPGMTGAEVEDLSRRIDLTALRGYWNAVAANTTDLVGGLNPADLDVVVDPDRVRRIVADEAALIPAGAWVGDFWAGNRNRGWFLLQTALLHPYGHLFDAMAIKGVLGATT